MFSFTDNLPDFYAEKSLLDISVIVENKRSGGVYNFDSLPATAVVTQSKNVLSRSEKVFRKELKGLPGRNYLVNKSHVLCTDFGNGAPAVITLLEELRTLGVSNFIFIGYAGSLIPEMKEGDICYVAEAFSTVGCTAFYSPAKSFSLSESVTIKKMISSLGLKRSLCWSTDAPYRETKSLVSSFRQKGATHVDMECAAIYAFSEFYKLQSLCIVITADSFSENKWSMPRNMPQLHRQLKSLVTKITSLSDEF